MTPIAPLTDTSLQTVRAHRAELRESIGALEQALAGPTPGRVAAWAERVHVALVELSGDLREHVALTAGPQGLHHEVLATAPRLAGAVRRLADEHVTITELVERMISGVSVPLDDDGVAATRGLGVRLLGRLVQHRQAGADMIYEAYQTDIGGET